MLCDNSLIKLSDNTCLNSKSQARQRDEEYLEPNRKAEPQAEKGDTKFQSQVDKQHADAQSKGAASLASEKEKLQKASL